MDYFIIIMLAAVIVLIAHTVKGLTGFASSLISVPLLALFLDIKFVVPVVTITTLVSGAILFWKTRKDIKKDEFIIVLVFVIIGSFIGIRLLAGVDSLIIKKVFSILVVLFGLNLLFINRPSRRRDLPGFWGAIAGFIGGILGGMFDTNGPPLIIYFSQKLNKQQFRATLVAIFFIDAIWRNGLYIANGITNWETLKFGLLMLPPLILGVLLGMKLHIRVNEAAFKKVVGIILLITGGLLFY